MRDRVDPEYHDGSKGSSKIIGAAIAPSQRKAAVQRR